MSSNGSSKQYNLSAFQFGIAGASTGFVTRFLLQPLDVLKIRFQLQAVPAELKQKAKYTSLLQALNVITKEEGVSALWKGHIPAQILSIIYAAVQFSTYEVLTEYAIVNSPYKNSGMEHLINISTGSIAGLTATVASFPFDVVRTHLVYQSKQKVYKGTIDAIRQIYMKEGYRGFSKGMLAACLQAGPMTGLSFCFRGLFTQAWLLVFHEINSTKSSYLTTTGSVATGFLAGFCSKIVVYPFDLMKKRLQIQGFDESRSYCKGMIKCRGIVQCFVLTLRYEGFFGLFKGLYPSLIKASVTNSMYFTIYDKFCQFLEFS